MLIAILVGVYFAAGFAAAALGFILDRFPSAPTEALIRQYRDDQRRLLERVLAEQAAFRAEILASLRGPAVDPKAFSRQELEEHPEGWFMRPAQRARAQRGH